MANNKKDIEKFQAALSSNTEFLNEDKLEDEVLFGSEKTPEFIVPVEKLAFKQFKILAMYQKRDVNDVIQEALNHYLRLKKMYIEEAIKELTKEK